MSNMNFIRTTDIETCQKLREAGFTEITESGSNQYVFLNDKNMEFDMNAIELMKFSYSNKLYI